MAAGSISSGINVSWMGRNVLSQADPWFSSNFIEGVEIKGDQGGLMLKSLLLFGIASALCASALAQSTFRWEPGNAYAYNSYRYKSIGFQNIVVRVAEALPVRYGVRQFAAFPIIVLNEDKERRVELDSDQISCDCGRRKTLSAVPFRKVILSRREIFAGNPIFPWTSYTGIVLFDGTCGARDTRLVTIRLGDVTFHYLF
jgi:hypothetical protein